MDFRGGIPLDKRFTPVVIFLIFIFALVIPSPQSANSTRAQITDTTTLNPSNTVIISNKFDERFSKDYSVLLKHLRLDWIVLDAPEVPDSVQDKNLILLGQLESEHIGQLIRSVLSADEIETIQLTKYEHIILVKESPWMNNRTIFICSAAKFLDRRNAAEELIHSLIADAPPTSNWIRTTYDFDLDEEVHNHISRLQYEIDDPELPLEDLTIDVEGKPPRKITSQEAGDDVERLFYLLSHGYSGYAFFNQNSEFESAKKNILEQLSSKSSWTQDAFASLLHEHLSFIVDFHLSIGEYKFAEHRDFWYAPDFELILDEKGYQFQKDNKIFTLDAINEADPTTLHPAVAQSTRGTCL